MIKYSGAGNTFVILKGSEMRKSKRIRFTKSICSPTFGVQVDGVLFLEKGTGPVDWVWDFYNSDGSRAEMCGNAARCATQFVFEELKFKKKSVTFLTAAGLIQCKKIKKKYFVEMPKVKILEFKKTVLTKQRKNISGDWINSGVPHFVIQKSLKQGLKQYLLMAKELRHHKKFLNPGANITFFEKINATEINAVTFERGVENFTLACGTGAVAAALSHSKNTKVKLVKVHMPGGDLSIAIQENNKIIMSGPSEKIAEIIWNKKNL